MAESQPYLSQPHVGPTRAVMAAEHEVEDRIATEAGFGAPYEAAELDLPHQHLSKTEHTLLRADLGQQEGERSSSPWDETSHLAA